MKYSLLAVPLLISTGLHAQAPTPEGDQFQVNTYTPDEQSALTRRSVWHLLMQARSTSIS